MSSVAVWPGGDAGPSLAAVHRADWSHAAGIALTESARSADVVLAILDADVSDASLLELQDFAGGRPILLAATTARAFHSPAVAGLTGLSTVPGAPEHEVRVRRGVVLDPRAEGDLLFRASWPLVEKVADDVEVLATANTAFTDHPVMTWRPSTNVGAVTLVGDEVWECSDLLRTIHRWSRHVRGVPERPANRVGLLAYGAIGHEHLSACLAVPGLELAAVCDRSPQRLDAALADAPGLFATTDNTELLARDDVDLVIVSTPPDTHAMWALRALEAGKHVVLEKPMALTSIDCDAVLESARNVSRTALVYQNRRFDSDFLTLKRAIDQGRIGDVFHTETFVGGYGHPCNYWHSDAGVSGGAIFDWGSHFIDQLLNLTDAQVVSVTASNHKRQWLDVTNADHSRVTLRFDDGAEAEFIHSDLAAVLKPKYYVLGTEGAIVGSWRHERLLSRTGIGTMAEERFAPADAPADLTMVNAQGDSTLLAPVQPREYAFHRELADHLASGLPMSVKAQQSRDVVAVMEAAEQSAMNGSTPVVPAGMGEGTRRGR